MDSSTSLKRGQTYRVRNSDNSPAGNPSKTVNSSVHIILPAYNEEESLPKLLQRLAGHDWKDSLQIWVVDDGSYDQTADVAGSCYDDLTIHLIRHQVNMGLGQALYTGLRNVLNHGHAEDIVMVMDADDTHDVALIEPLCNSIIAGADIAIASRYVSGGCDKTAPFHRRLLSRGAAFIFSRILPLSGIHDFTSGYRAYRLDLLHKAKHHWGERLIEEQGFACMVELLLKLRYWEPRIEEIPFKLRYDRKRGESKLRLFRTLMQYLKLALRNRLSPPPVLAQINKI